MLTSTKISPHTLRERHTDIKKTQTEKDKDTEPNTKASATQTKVHTSQTHRQTKTNPEYLP